MGRLVYRRLNGPDVVHTFNGGVDPAVRKTKAWRQVMVATERLVAADPARAVYTRDADGRLHRRPETLPRERRGKGGAWKPYRRQEAAA
jgi:hypothetical protein